MPDPLTSHIGLFIVISESGGMKTRRSPLLLLGLAGSLALLTPVTAFSSGLKEFCNFDRFNASCPDGHVIIMTSAKYGRMKVGKCLQTDYYTGCAADVMDHMDSLCSGRQSCSMQIPDEELYKVQTCRKDLVAYFEASYDCMPVAGSEQEDGHRCAGPVTLTQPEGYLASYITRHTRLGSARCPWSLQVPSGQRINVTLYDFTARSLQTYPGAGKNYQAACPIYAVFKEEGALEYLRLCGSRTRRKLVYTSRSNVLEVHIVNISKETSGANFLLKYEGTGCPDIEPQENGYFLRKDDTLIVSCNYTAERWHLVCKGNEWIGSIRNCSRGPGSDLRTQEEALSKQQEFPFGLLIAIAIGIIIGIVLGFVFLMVVFNCRKRNKRRRQRERNALLMDHQSQESGDQNIYKLINLKQGPPPKDMPCDCVLAAEVQLANNALDGKLDNEQNSRTLQRRELDYDKGPHGRLLIEDTYGRATLVKCNAAPIDGVRCHGDTWCPAEEIYKANLKWETYPRSEGQKQMVTFKGDPDVTLHDCQGDSGDSDDPYSVQRPQEEGSRECLNSNNNKNASVEVNAHAEVRYFPGTS